LKKHGKSVKLNSTEEGLIVVRSPMTPEGYKNLQAELERLLKVDRPKNIQAIAEARAHGDLSENAEYHAAKEKQSFMEGRINELQSKLSTAEVIDSSKFNHSKAVFGAKVKLLNVDSGEECCFTLVGSDEADVKTGKISITSPAGKALIGKEVGDVAVIKAPAKTIEYEILEINFG
jgi:transcription elongation factor GreA